MSRPAFRIIPAPWWERTAGVDPETWLEFDGDSERVALATSALGLRQASNAGRAIVRGTRQQLEALHAELILRGSPHAPHLAAYLGATRGWRLRTRTIDLSSPAVMGILNLTIDSFSGDGVGTEVEAALAHAESLRAAGATIVDIGAESARADRPVFDPHQEAELVGNVVLRLVREGHVISADTYKPEVAAAALEAGAEIINDISGLTLGTGAAAEAARFRSGYILNYSYSPPKVRPDVPPAYEDVVLETLAWTGHRLETLKGVGLEHGSLAIDPGIAFGKSHDEDLQVLRRIGELCSLGLPVLLAHSRKNFIGSLTGRPPSDRDLETHVSTVLAYVQGARIFRVHDVAGTRRALAIAEAIIDGEPGRWAPGWGTWPWAAEADAAHMTVADPDKPAPGGQRW